MTDSKLFSKTVDELVRLIKKADAETDLDKKYPIYTKLQLASATAYKSLSDDFISAVIQKLEADGFEFGDLMRWTFFFECLSCNVVDDQYTHSLMVMPFMASSAYGLPFGEIPAEALKKIEQFLKGLFTPEYQIRLNKDMLSTDTFALRPYEMQSRIKQWLAKSKPGICRFVDSEETREEMTELVADIRLIAFIVSTPIKKLPLSTFVSAVSLKKREKNLVFGLKRIFTEHYPATHLEFLQHPSDEFREYLSAVDNPDNFNTSLMLPCIASMMEAGRLFRHFSLKEALAKLFQTDGYSVKDLQITIAPFYEQTTPGEAKMAEFRIGISLKGENSKVYQGLGWPVFFDDPADVLDSLEATLLFHKFEHEQVRFISNATFLLEDEDEEVRYPAFDGKLYEPFIREEVSYLTPTLYQLN